MSLQQLNPDRFEGVIYDECQPCLVLFSRKNCHVCKVVVPVLEELSPQYEGKFGFYYVDVEEDRSLVQRFTLKGVPQILFFNEGEYKGKIAGKVEEEDIEDKITEVLRA